MSFLVHFTFPEIGHGLFALIMLAALLFVLLSSVVLSVTIARMARQQLRRFVRMMVASSRPEPSRQSASA